MNPAQKILIIQVSGLGKMALRSMLSGRAKAKFEENTHYLFFETFAGARDSFFAENRAQLILTSHVPGTIDAYEVADEAISSNSRAIVFALTSTMQAAAIEAGNQKVALAGVIPKLNMRPGFLPELLEAFLAEKSKEELVKMTKECQRPS